MTALQILGLVGGACFAYCGVPAAYATIKAKKSIGTPISVAAPIFVGAISMYAYLVGSYGFDWLLALNYGIEILSWGVIVFFHFFPSKEAQ